jgi:hypothetical protein
MQVTINIPDELAAQVHARGLALEDYVRDLLASEVSQAKARFIRFGLGPSTPEEAAHSIRESRQSRRLNGLNIKDLINEGRRF